MTKADGAPAVSNTGYKFLENLPLGICITDAEATLVYVNTRFERWTGRKREELEGNRLFDAFPELQNDKYRIRLEQVLRGGPAAVFSSQLHPHMFPMPLPDGLFRIQNTTVNLFIDEAEQTRMLIAVQDVTETVRHLQRIKDLRKQTIDEVKERERVQAAHLKSEQRYRSIFEHSPLGIMQFDLNGDLISANQRIGEIFGLDRGLMIGRNIIDIMPRDLLKLAQKSISGEITHFEGALSSVEGDRKTWVEANFAPIRSGTSPVDGVVGIIENVTDRVDAQQELKQSQEMLSSINRNIREGIYRSEPFRGLIYSNEAFARMLGASSPGVLYGRTIRSMFVEPSEHDHLENKLSLQGSIINEEARLRRRDGTEFWALMSVVATYGLNGEILWYDGAVTDITDRRADNERLRESEEQYRNLFQNSRAGMYRCDWQSGKLLKANRQTLAILGYQESDEIFTQYVFKSRRDWKRMFALLRKNGEIDGLEFEGVKSNGEEIWISISATLYKEEGFFEGVILDITRRKWAEKVQGVIYTVADRTSANIPFRTYLQEIYEATSDVVSLQNMVVAHLNEDGHFEYDFIEDKFLEEDHPAWKDHSWLHFVAEKGEVQLFQRAQIERLMKDQSIRKTANTIFSWLAAPIKTGSKVVGVIAVCSYELGFQFSQREKEIITYVAHHVGTAMERRRNEEKMIDALEVAQQASQTKSQFLANMSHELRTPLNSIIGYSRRLLKVKNELNEAQVQAIEVISRNAASLLEMINEVLDLSRLDAGKFSFSIQKIALNDLARQVKDELEPLAAQKGILLEMVHSKPVLALADPSRFRQVLINIIGNAIKFTDHGSVSISVERAALSEQEMVVVGVSDTGVGIPEEKIRSIFNVFEQANPERDSARGGSGLGLAISARLLEEMKGYITVHSKPGAGSRFDIFIPAAE